MLSKLTGAATVAAALQLTGISGVANAAVINVLANEIEGTPSEPTFLTLTATGPGAVTTTICGPANEDLTDCTGTQRVPQGFINPGTPIGTTVEVNLWDVLPPSPVFGTTSSTSVLDRNGIPIAPGSTTVSEISDELYLTLSSVSAGFATLSWCWDSDREASLGGLPVICPETTGATVFDIQEPTAGPIDLTRFFTSPNGPLSPTTPAGVAQWSVIAISEVPEPASLVLLGTGLLGFAFARRRKQT